MKTVSDVELDSQTKTRGMACASCPFEGAEPISLAATSLGKIRSYLLAGQNHLCHSDRSNHTVCRGGRNYQLQMWHRLGLIEVPTDEALARAMKACGIAPRQHI